MGIYEERSEQYKIESEKLRQKELISFSNRKEVTLSVKKINRKIRYHKLLQFLDIFKLHNTK